MLCTQEDCGGPVLARGLCNKHYKAWRRSGAPEGRFVQVRDAQPCTEPSCDSAARIRGYCGKHYKRAVRSGEIDTGAEVVLCRVEQCDRRVSARGLCHGHYIRWSRTGDVAPERPLQRPAREQCSVEGCEKGVHSRGWCRAHYARWLSGGDVRADVPLRVVAGDGHMSHGYLRVLVEPHERWLVDGASVALEHRLVMARMLGRPLTRSESVHHVNGDRTCNAPENLELWSRYQPNGQRVADKVAWAREILRRYGDEYPEDDEETLA